MSKSVVKFTMKTTYNRRWHILWERWCMSSRIIVLNMEATCAALMLGTLHTIEILGNAMGLLLVLTYYAFLIRFWFLIGPNKTLGISAKIIT